MTNPFFETWATPYGAPPFAAIETAHFRPAYAEALDAHQAEIATIAGDAAAPSFDNTIAALERSGKPLRRVEMVFGQLASAATNDELQAFQYSVDLVVNLADVVNLRPVLRRGVARPAEFYAPVREALTAEGYAA